MGKIVGIRAKKFNNYISVLWNISSICNYKCSYCRPYLHDNQSMSLNIQTFKCALDKIMNKFQDQHVRIWFTGGEPTLNKEFLGMLKYAADEYKDRASLGMTSNGTKNVEYYYEAFKYLNSITFSCHFEQGNEDELLEKVKNLTQYIDKNCDSKFVSASINVMMEPLYWDRVTKFIAKCNEMQIHFDMMKLHGGYYGYTEEQEEFMKQGSYTYKDIYGYDQDGNIQEFNSNKFCIMDKNKCKDWKCTIGMNSFFIWNDGSVYRGECEVGDLLGNVYTGDFEISNVPVVCTCETCNSISDLRIMKYISDNIRNKMENIDIDDNLVTNIYRYDKKL